MSAPAGAPDPRRLSRVPAMADGEVVAVVADIARSLRAREADITRSMSALLAREIDHLDDDPQLIGMLEASVHGNIATILHVLANDIPVDHLQPTTAAVEYALRLAQREVPSNSLVRAYHMGQNDMMRICYEELHRRELPAPLALSVIKHLSEVLYSYIDWITLYVFDAYEAERGRWMNARGSVHSSTIHALLASDTPDTTAFESETQYRLDQTHLALILWHVGADHPSTLTVLDNHARSIARALTTDTAPIITAIDRRTAWAWLPFGRRRTGLDTADLDKVELDAGVRIAVGLPGNGLNGFRRSHQQAAAAYFVATVPGSPSARPIVGFGDPGVAVVSLLAKDLDSTRAWVHEVLGELAQDTKQAAVLRETLSTYYATGESHLHTAQQLTLHRNTVKYRINKALNATRSGGGNHRDKLDIALALQVCRFLGASIVRPAT